MSRKRLTTIRTKVQDTQLFQVYKRKLKKKSDHVSLFFILSVAIKSNIGFDIFKTLACFD